MNEIENFIAFCEIKGNGSEIKMFAWGFIALAVASCFYFVCN